MSYPPIPNGCADFTDCGTKTTVDDTNAGGASWSHNIENTIGTDTTLYQLKTVRKFTCSYSDKQSKGIIRVVGDQGNYYNCAKPTSSPQASISEDCTIKKRIPYYIDRTQDIYVYREVEESLKFGIESGKTAIFRQMWGNVAFHKILIKSDVKAKGSERFILKTKDKDKKDVFTTLAEATYTFNPFPLTEPQNTYGLNGDVITQDCKMFGTPEKDVIQVIILPAPPSLGIPQDADVCKYGFYDYLSLFEGGGMQFSALMQKDGGMDFFYPEWCRNMEYDPLWAEARTRRFELNYPGVGVPKPTLIENAAWNPPAPDVFQWPFGSFCRDSQDDFIYSCLLKFSDRSNAGTKIVHHSTFGDLKKAIFADNNLTLKDNWIITPVAPL